jgi:hypothetical protein
MKTLPILMILLSLVALPALAADPQRIVVCAPGYPSNTEEAQPTMDAFAAAIAARMEWPAQSLVAEYHPNLEDGLAALRRPQTALAILALPMFLEHHAALDIQPRLTAVSAAGNDESWTLVAAKGRISQPSDLEGWAVAGMAGYSPRFVRHVALGGWGELPAGSEIRFESRVLSALRAASRGDQLAVLLDSAQSDALSSLPYAKELEVVTRSPALDGSLWCNVGARMDAETLEALDRALIDWHNSEDGQSLLSTFRLSRFEAIDANRLEEIIERFSRKPASP